jgi:hypothetical protein
MAPLFPWSTLPGGWSRSSLHRPGLTPRAGRGLIRSLGSKRPPGGAGHGPKTQGLAYVPAQEETMPRIRLKKQPEVEDTPETRARALLELGIDQPYYTCRVVGGRLEFTLYGGGVVFWPEDVGAGPGARPKED